MWKTAVLPLVVVKTPLPRLLPLLLLGADVFFSIAKGTALFPTLGLRPMVEPMLVPLSTTERPTPEEGVAGCEVGEAVLSISSFSRRSARLPA